MVYPYPISLPSIDPHRRPLQSGFQLGRNRECNPQTTGIPLSTLLRDYLRTSLGLQAGNARPRVFRLEEDSAIINRYGFPSQGHTSVLSRLRARIPPFSASQSGNETAACRDGSLLAINLGKNKDSPLDSIHDFLKGVQTFGPYADVLVVNVSSPNTPGLRCVVVIMSSILLTESAAVFKTRTF
jgi:dihydroorotate dehydrogenase